MYKRQDNSEQPVWPEEGAIQLSKSAAAVEGKENTWEVTLGIQGKNYKTTSDVVLVIDNSNSMYPSKTSKEDRMTKTKAAANAFVDTLLTEDSTTRIALVVYNLEETHTGFYTYADKESLKSQINAITQNQSDGGTFTQLGLHTARTCLLYTSAVARVLIAVDLQPAQFIAPERFKLPEHVRQLLHERGADRIVAVPRAIRRGHQSEDRGRCV